MHRLGLVALLGGVACRPTSAPVVEPVAAPEIAADVAFVGVDVFDGVAWIDDATVLVADDRIVAVGRDLAVPAAATRVEGAGQALLPGLIDAHVHVQNQGDPKQALAFGVTTEIDMFTLPEVAASVRASSRTRADVVSAGILATSPGGHGTEYGVPIPTLSRPEEAEAFVAARIDEGSAFLKIVVGDGAELGLRFTTLDAATVGALVTAAHRRELSAVVHVGTLADAEIAVAAGADGLAHMFTDRAPTPAFIAAAKAGGVFVTDTLAVLSSICDGRHGPALADDPRISPWLRQDDELALRTPFVPPSGRPSCALAFAGVLALHRAGVPILASTDAPNPGTVHGASLLGELSLLVEAGLSPTDALASATSKPAAAFGLDDRGRIAVGRRADLLLVRGDPRDDITFVRDIVAVYKGGRAFDREPLRKIAELERAAVVRLRTAAPPPALLDGISSFDDGTLATGFGAGWQPSTDQLRGGTSTVTLSVVPEAKRGRNRVLSVAGDLAAGPAAWAGAAFFPGATPMAPANLTTATTLEFRARGPGRVVVMLFTAQGGAMPAATSIAIGPTLGTHRVALRDLVVDPYDVTMIFIGQAPLDDAGAPRSGPFHFELDDVRLR
ncbi:MAG: amidohydrolase family protein [Myxococcales bacterium]|nr:amidohydrolase family protein [Myxococcales bacterium]